MNQSNPLPHSGIADATKLRLQRQANNAIKAFFTEVYITDVIKHLNLICSDAITLRDAEDEPFHDHYQTIKIVEMNARVVNLLVELNFCAKHLHDF